MRAMGSAAFVVPAAGADLQDQYAFSRKMHFPWPWRGLPNDFRRLSRNELTLVFSVVEQGFPIASLHRCMSIEGGRGILSSNHKSV
jgi:hypothetical protein